MRGADPLVERHPHCGAGTFRRLMFARGIDEDAAHHLRGDRKEVRAIAPGDALLSNQPQVRLVDECRRLECMVLPFVSQVRARSSSQFGIDDRHQVVARLHVATAPGVQQTADRVCLTGLAMNPSAT
jgi:hypothetical protein